MLMGRPYPQLSSESALYLEKNGRVWRERFVRETDIDGFHERQLVPGLQLSTCCREVRVLLYSHCMFNILVL